MKQFTKKLSKIPKQFSKQFLAIIIGGVILIAGGVLIFATGSKGAPPVAYWKFDEGSASSTYDSSGNANTGTLTGGVQWASGVYGTGLSFDGVDDYVSVPHNANQLLTTGGTVSAWVYINGYGDLGGGRIVDKADDASVTKGYSFRVGDGGLLAGRINAGTTIVSGSNAAPLNTWIHVAMSFNSSGLITFYANGVLSGTPAVSASASGITTVKPVIIGDNFLLDRSFNGLIDDVRIYDYARTADQVRADYNAGKALYVGSRAADCDVSPADCVNKGLVGHWDMDQMGGQTASDKSGNGNNGTLGASASPATDDPVWAKGVQPFSGGKSGGGGLSFDGNNDYVDVAYSASLDITQALTISQWVKINTVTPLYQVFVGKVNTSDIRSYEVATNYARLLVRVTPTISFTTTNNFFTTGEWIHITYTYSDANDKVKVYKNGILFQEWDSSAVMTTNIAKVAIGRWGEQNNYYVNGLIDDVRIYNRALSAAEIRYQYNQAKPIAHWKFDEGSASSTYDSSGNANTGTLTGGVQWASGVYGTGLSFDGVNDYVSVASPVNIDIVTNYSGFAWIKTTAIAQGTIFRKDGISDFGLFLRTYANGALNAWIYKNDGSHNAYMSTASSILVNNGDWHYVGFSYDESVPTLTIYIDGVIAGVDTTADGIKDSGVGDFLIGGALVGYFNGLIDDVRIYNYARTADQVRADYNAGAAMYVGAKAADCDVSPADCVNKGLVGHWDMDQMGGTTATDKSGNNNTGTLTNGPTWTKGIQPFSGGKAGGGALSFDGVNDYVSTSDSDIFDTGSQLTVGLWYKTSNQTLIGIGLLTHDFSNYKYIASYISGGDSSSMQCYVRTASGVSSVLWVPGAAVLADNKWHYTTCVYDKNASDGNRLKLYFDGLQKATSTGYAEDISDGDEGIVLGRWSPTSNFFNGLIDDVRIYNRALSAGEIRYQYNQGKPIAWWKMDSVGVSGTPGTALNVYDDSGKGNTGVSSGETMNNGTISGALWKSGPDCKYGSCLKFDGVDDYVSVGTYTKPSSFTISLWVNFASYTQGGYAGMVFSGDGNTLWGLVANDAWSGKITLSVSNGIAPQRWKIETLNSTNYPAGWHHLVGIGNGSTLSYYKNGIFATSTSQTIANSGTSNLSIGRWGTYENVSSYFNGSIDDVRIYNTALTAPQVLALYNNNDRSAGASLEGNLVGEWKFDEMGTSYVADTHYQRIGKYGSAMKFDGTDDYVSVADNASLKGMSAITVSAWIKPNTIAAGYTGIVSKWVKTTPAGTNRPYILERNGANVDFGVNGQVLWSVGSPLVVGNWYHIVGVYDSTGTHTKNIYINGVFNTSDTLSSGVVQSSETIEVAFGVDWITSASPKYFNGLIDDVRIYDYARSADQIKQDYNAGAALRLGN